MSIKATTLAEIINLTDPADLDRLERAIRDRRKTIARVMMTDLQPGQKVKFNDRIRPTYLAGLEATVVQVNRESVTVNCPDELRYGRFKGSKRVRVPNSLIAA